MRAVFDPNGLVSAVISPTGAPAQLIRRWRLGDFELVVSEQLLDELTRALGYPMLQPYVDATDGEEILAALRADAVSNEQPDVVPVSSRDPDDDYLIALAAGSGAALVSGDSDLLVLTGELPIFSPAQFAERLDQLPEPGS